MAITLTEETKRPKALPAGGPHTNDTFEQLRQFPRSEYSISQAYSMAMIATGEQPVRGDRIVYSDAEHTWTVLRIVGTTERKIVVYLVQVTNSGSIQFRFFDSATNAPWRSIYLPTGPLFRSANRRGGKNGA